jgi:Cu/Ag efflux protein CusF
MRNLRLLSLVVAAACAPAALAQKPEVSSAVTTSPGKGTAVQTVKATATVESVDATTRGVKLKLPSGEVRTLIAGDDVRNFDQIKPGDKVTVRYIEALTLELKKDGKAVVGRSEKAAVDRAATGAKPGGIASREITAVADVVKVDAAKKIVSVKNDKGEIIDLNIKDPEQLKLVKKGDQIQATYNAAIAISLEPAAPAKK